MRKTRRTPFDPGRWTPAMEVETLLDIPVRVLCTDGPKSAKPIVGIYDGRCVDEFVAKELCFVEEPVQTVWINYYGDGKQAFEYETKKEADAGDFGDRLACFEVEKMWQSETAK